MKITVVKYFPIRLSVIGDSKIGTDGDPDLQRKASPESMAAQRFKAPVTGVVRIQTVSGHEGTGDGATLPH